MRAGIWRKCCVSTDVGTWTNWLTFEPDPDYSLDAETGLLSPISYALQRGILLRRENPTGSDAWFYNAFSHRGSGRNNFVGGTCALPSALLVYIYIYISFHFIYNISVGKADSRRTDTRTRRLYSIAKSRSSIASHLLRIMWNYRQPNMSYRSFLRAQNSNFCQLQLQFTLTHFHIRSIQILSIDLNT